LSILSAQPIPPAHRIEVPRAFLPLLQPARYKGAYGGRGSGKSHFFASQLITRCLRERTRAVCIREVQNTIKESVKQLLEDKIRASGYASAFQLLETEIRCPHNGLIIFRGMQRYNSENIKSLEDYDIAWVEEAQTLSETSLRLLRPTIRKKNSELWFSWNPRRATDAVDRFLRGPERPADAIVVQVGWQDNPWFPEVLRRELEYDYARDRDLADHVWGGNYEVVTEGAYYARLLLEAERDGRITDVPYEPAEPVYTAWDLGIDDCTVVWCAQIVGYQVRVIDYYETRNEALLDVARHVLRLPYAYAEHYLPHDVDTREISTARTRREQLEAIGLRPIRPGSRLPVADGINAVRTLIPKCAFDARKCAAGLEHLRNYRTEYVEELDTYRLRPRHDAASHAADAFRELAVQLFDLKAARELARRPVADSDYDPLVWGTGLHPVHDEWRIEDIYRPW